VSGLRRSFRIAAQLADATAAGASNSGGSCDAEIRSGRWRCRNEQCARKTFAEALAIALPSARKTQRVDELVRLFAHAAGGGVSERLLTRLGMPVSDNAILRQLKSHVRK
jgi:hypothetical protein